jgi:cytochrome c-type biogenesis protein CcmF
VSASVWRLLAATPLAVWGLVLAHAGLGVSVIGISGVSAWQSSEVLMMAQGESAKLAGQTVRLDGVLPVQGPNYQASQAVFTVEGAFGSRKLIAERRFFPASRTPTTQAGIGSGPFGNTFVSIGDPDPQGRILVRLARHPFVGWIWGGGMLMALGGAVSLADRRWRFAAVRRPSAVPAAVEQAA